jgi:hypothetical protein
MQTILTCPPDFSELMLSTWEAGEVEHAGKVGGRGKAVTERSQSQARENPKKRPQAGSRNENNKLNEGASIPHKVPKLRKPALLQALPSDAGPWLKRCVNRWHLVAPFDTTISEKQWEQYYKERLSLDWFTNEAKGHSEDDKDFYDEFLRRSDYPLVEWTEDFPPPRFSPYANHGEAPELNDDIQAQVKSIRTGIKNVIKGCYQLTEYVENIDELVASGLYVLYGGAKWMDPDMADCYKFNILTRLYSPFGLGTSVDLQLDPWVCRVVLYVDHWATIKVAVRTVADCQHMKPQNTPLLDDFYNQDSDENKRNEKRRIILFSMSREPSGYYERNFINDWNLSAIEEALFALKKPLSQRKIFSLLIHAVMGVVIYRVSEEDMDDILRASRRKWKKDLLEEGDSSDDDSDSENEAKKNTKVRYGSDDYSDSDYDSDFD